MASAIFSIVSRSGRRAGNFASFHWKLARYRSTGVPSTVRSEIWGRRRGGEEGVRGRREGGKRAMMAGLGGAVSGRGGGCALCDRLRLPREKGAPGWQVFVDADGLDSLSAAIPQSCRVDSRGPRELLLTACSNLYILILFGRDSRRSAHRLHPLEVDKLAVDFVRHRLYQLRRLRKCPRNTLERI